MKKECKNPMLSNGYTIGNVVNQEARNHLAHSAAVAAGLDKTPNYVISGGTLTYRVTPATATYTADSRTKIYGNAVLEPDVHNTGTWYGKSGVGL